MCRKIVLQIAQGTEDSGMPRVLGDRYSNGFFSTSRANKDGGELLLDNADYSTSSSPQWPKLYSLWEVRIQYLPLVQGSSTISGDST
jgi:hypothetical protein